MHRSATPYRVEKKERQQFSVSDAANTVKEHLGSRSRCSHGPIQYMIVHTCDLNNQMLNFFFLILAEGIQSLQRLIVQTQFLSKLKFNPKNCVWTSVAADSHSSLLSLAKRHIKNVGLQTTKQATERPLVSLCVVTVSFQVRFKPLACYGAKRRGTGPIKWRKPDSASCNVFFEMCVVVGPIGIYTLSNI